jgi:hypothetical protein
MASLLEGSQSPVRHHGEDKPFHRSGVTAAGEQALKGLVYLEPPPDPVEEPGAADVLIETDRNF